ncbi:MAG: hypothetical protein EXS15_03380 [Phycisphaerales bacterium]|nr:hypothetical protein [Phycisphaerales bacterium]
MTHPHPRKILNHIVAVVAAAQLVGFVVESLTCSAAAQSPANRGVEPASQPTAPPQPPVEPPSEPLVDPVAPTQATSPVPAVEPAIDPVVDPPVEPTEQPAEPSAVPSNGSSADSPVDPPEQGAAEPANAANDISGTSAAQQTSVPIVLADDPPRIVRQFRGDRRPIDMTELVLVNFKEIKVEDLFPFIVECTGKAVLPRLAQLRTQTISVISDKAVTRLKALELIFQAFRLNDIAVVETDELIMVDMLTNVGKLQPVMVLGPLVDVLRLEENGQVVIKVFGIRNTRAQSVFDRLSASMPDYAKIDVDTNSNQIILEGDVGLAKRCQEIINVLDVEPFTDTRTETFQLRNADASVVADSITEIFSGASGTAAAPRAQNRQGARPGQNPNQQAAASGAADGPTLVVTVLAATNSITVRSDPRTIAKIGELIATAWDIPPTRNGAIFKSYDLKFTDPLKVKVLLKDLLESGGGSSSSAGGRGGNSPRLAGGGGGADSGADVAVANIFKIEAYPDSNRLIIVTKTPDNFEWLDELIAKIDKPLTVGMPVNVQLKYASSVDVAEIINALLAESGAGTGIQAPDEGLSGIDFGAAGGGTTSGESTTSASGDDGGSAGGSTIEFPWQNARGGGDGAESTEVSAIIGKSRVVPNAGQNSLLVLATPEIQEAVITLITELDKPGRQVMISAILAEVELGDQFAMGIQFGPAGSISPANPNNAVVIGSQSQPLTFSGAKDAIFPSVLNVSNFSFGVDATVILQALQRDTSVRILQQPRVFTSDNKEAVFFAGQDVPFLTGTTTGGSTGGGTTSSFEQIAVGIGLNVRPRITKERNVAMEIEVLLSNVNTASSINVSDSGNPVIDRRQTNTQITVKNNQTIVISGVRIETETREKNGFPLLGSIPILDLFFSNKNKSAGTKELLIFITPSVVDNPDENDTNFNADERERLDVISRPLNAKSEKMVEKHKLNLPAKTGDQPVDPLAPIDPSISP